jgi:MULE transposase domain
MAKLRVAGGKVLSRDIYNLGQRIRLESLGGLTPIQWLKQELDLQGYYNRIDVDSTSNKVTRLFYMHPTVIGIWKKNPDCLLLDCTYKTNRFNMPLLNICGVTGNNKTPQFALCFLTSEKDVDYKWALKQLRECMVRILLPGKCHDNRYILTLSFTGNLQYPGTYVFNH